MSIDAVFEQPDIDPDIASTDDRRPIPTYTATATRTGKQWTATITGLPEGRTAQAHGPTWGDTELAAFSVVGEILDAEPATYTVRLVPADPTALDALDTLVQARLTLAHAEQAVRDAARNAARTLTDQGWTTRDTGTALRLSHQRISQLVNSPST
ncbi:hypothetical protein ACIRL2_41580 [Embleya sp. NPDC127516]|uniref:hypothetical protein n=1 Tax=Embleya sp. NPDC127516 TaxID=3363990 RepID=UPI003804D7F0